MGHTELVSYLIKQGAQVNMQEGNGWFPLMYAVKAGDLEAVKVLIAHGASIHLKSVDEKTLFDTCPQELLLLPLFQELVSLL